MSSLEEQSADIEAVKNLEVQMRCLSRSCLAIEKFQFEILKNSLKIFNWKAVWAVLEKQEQ